MAYIIGYLEIICLYLLHTKVHALASACMCVSRIFHIGEGVLTSKVNNQFNNMDLSREAFGPYGSNCFLKGVCTSISKESYSHLWFFRGRWGVWKPHLVLPMCLQLSFSTTGISVQTMKTGFLTIVNSLPPGKYFMFFCCLLSFFKINFFEKFFQEYHQCVKKIGSRSGSTFCPAWSWFNLFAKVISRRH